MYYVYVLYSKNQDKFYIGFTDDLRRRMQEHISQKSLSDRRLRNPELVYYEACVSKSDSMKREKQLKTGFGRQYLRNRLKNLISPHSSTDRA